MGRLEAGRLIEIGIRNAEGGKKDDGTKVGKRGGREVRRLEREEGGKIRRCEEGT